MRPVKLGLLGYPLGHTLSPLLHEILLREAGLPGEYHPYETPPDFLAEQLEMLHAEGVMGLNVTLPYKVEILPFLDAIEDDARLIQAVNTLAYTKNGLIGYNTDVGGFAKSLPEAIRADLPSRTALILGAGGAARGVLAALIGHGVSAVTIAARAGDQTRALAAIGETLRRHHQAGTRFEVTPLAHLEDLSAYQLVVNTTPLGMAPQTNTCPLSLEQLQTLAEGAYVSDLIYKPQTTQLISHCMRLGIPSQGGLEMLIQQGIESFKLWTGETTSPSTVDRLRRQLQEAGASRHG